MTFKKFPISLAYSSFPALIPNARFPLHGSVFYKISMFLCYALAFLQKTPGITAGLISLPRTNHLESLTLSPAKITRNCN